MASGPAGRYDCVVIDDDPDICRLISHILSGIGVTSLGLHSVGALQSALASMRPSIVFLDVALGRWDAVDGIRILGQTGYSGAVQLISGKDPALVDAIKTIGEQHGLKMLKPLQKPFRAGHLKSLFEGNTIKVPSRPRLVSDSGETADASLPKIDLADALAEHWIDIAYQPKVDLVHGNVIGAEGLARLNHPVHGPLGPASFLPGASDAALYCLTEFMIRKAHLDWEVLASAGANVQLAINAPIRTLLDPGITELVRGLPDRDDWPGLTIEVTESEAIERLEAVAEAATQLRIYNVSLAIDDFGSGYSSFARLKQLPFSELKLDRSYVQNCGTDPMNAGICRSIVELARCCGAVSVAEGVETERERQALIAMGCKVGQGFHFGHPMRVGQLIERIVADRK